MAWVVSRNNFYDLSAAGKGEYLFPLKEHLVSSGLWTVIGSGDGNTLFEFSGTTGGAGTGSGGAYDVWATKADPDRDDAWLILQDPSGREMLLQSAQSGGATNGTGLRIMWDFNGNYTSAGISATVPPAATVDEQPLVGSRTTAGTISGATDCYMHFFAQDEVRNGCAAFHFLLTLKSGGTLHGNFALAPLQEGSTRSFDTQPYIFWRTASPQGGMQYEGGSLASATWYTGDPDLRALSRSPFYGSGFGTPGANFDPQIMSVGLVANTSSTGDRHFRGFLYEDQVKGIGGPNNTAPYRTPNFTQNGDITYIRWFDWDWFWDDTGTPPGVTNDAAASTIEAAEHITLTASAGGGGDVTPPVITINTPAGALPSRTASLTFDVSDDTAVGLTTVLVNFPTLGVTECAYHDGSFRAPYTGSTFSAPTFTLTRTGGWPADPTLDVSAVDTSGNIQS